MFLVSYVRIAHTTSTRNTKCASASKSGAVRMTVDKFGMHDVPCPRKPQGVRDSKAPG